MGYWCIETYADLRGKRVMPQAMLPMGFLTWILLSAKPVLAQAPEGAE